MDLSLLHPETVKVWRRIEEKNLLPGFVLIGGTALAMWIQHRKSEDLDFVLNKPLPRALMAAFMDDLKKEFTVVRDDNEDVYWEFINAGAHVYDSQQNFLVNGVKINVFTARPELGAIIDFNHQDRVRVAELGELFYAKVLAAAGRCVSRDWVDLYLLCKEHGFGVQDIEDTFKKVGYEDPTARVERAFFNLTQGKMPAKDPGYVQLMDQPPTLKEISSFFEQLNTDYEVMAAARVAKTKI